MPDADIVSSAPYRSAIFRRRLAHCPLAGNSRGHRRIAVTIDPAPVDRFHRAA
jgi:hypothetical protein